jgi:hypothetical protein
MISFFILTYFSLFIANPEILPQEEIQTFENKKTFSTLSFDIGDKYSPEKINFLSSDFQGVMESSGQIRESSSYAENNIQYTIAYNDDYNITYIQTNDKNFITEEGYSVSTTFEELEKKKFVCQPGWGCIVQLKNNWNAAFYPSDSIKNDQKIIFFFKRWDLLKRK